MSTALVHRGTLFDARGNVIRRGTDPRMERAQAFYSMMSGSYAGARSDGRELQDWSTSKASANADILGDLPELRGRSRDLERNAPIATGAINTVCTNAIGTGLTPQPSVDTEYLAGTVRRDGSAGRALRAGGAPALAVPLGGAVLRRRRRRDASAAAAEGAAEPSC